MQKSKESYPGVAFFIDCIDLVILLVPFYYLGFIFSEIEPVLIVVYLCIAAIPVLAYIGDKVAPRANRGTRWDVSIIVFVAGIVIPLFKLSDNGCANTIALVALYTSLFFYYLRIRSELPSMAKD